MIHSCIDVPVGVCEVILAQRWAYQYHKVARCQQGDQFGGDVARTGLIPRDPLDSANGKAGGVTWPQAAGTAATSTPEEI